MSTFLILFRDDYGGTVEVPLVHRSGELSEMGEWIAAALDADTFWKIVASDRAGVIVELREKLKEAAEVIAFAREKVGPLLREAAMQ